MKAIQNSPMLSDPGRKRSEVASFFTRHWGDSFVSKTTISASPQLPRITDGHFRQYLSTTAKKHRQYLKARKSLRKALIRQAEETTIEIDEVPQIFFSADFCFKDRLYFESVFLEPHLDENDRLVSEYEKRRKASYTPKPLSEATRTDSLNSVQSLQNQLPIEASGGRLFRPYKQLHNRLEYFHDTIGILLNHQLESKSEEFWKTVHSYTASQSELEQQVNNRRDSEIDLSHLPLKPAIESAIEKSRLVRKNMQKAKEEIYEKSRKIVNLYLARENRQKLLLKLNDIACLRDAQNTVQMLLNQNDFPKALECIETAQEVLNSDLRGVLCFRHLSSQLQEMNKIIAKMLKEEFVSLIQREFGKPIEKESECSYQEGQLHPVILGLLRCKDYSFTQILKEEIVEAVKNTVRQVVRGRIIECDSNLEGYDPSLVSLGEQIAKMTVTQWVDTLKAVLRSLYLLCCRVMSIQELILDNLALVEDLATPNRTSSPQPPHFGNVSQNSELEEAATTQSYNIRRNTSQTSFHSVASALSLPLLPSTSSLDPENKNFIKPRYSKSEQASIAAEDSIHEDDRDTPTMDDEALRKGSAATDMTMGDDSKSNSMARFSSPNSQNPSILLAVVCCDLKQVKSVTPLLLEHAIISCEERAGKLILARSKGGLLEKCSPETFAEVSKMVFIFVDKCRSINNPANTSDMNGGESLSTQVTSIRSPLQSAMQQQTTKYIAKFHERKRQKLGIILDSELWKPIDLPPVFQQLIDEYSKTGHLLDIPSILSSDSEADTLSSRPSTGSSSNEILEGPQRDYVVVDGEKFIVIGTALILLRILAQYCSLLVIFPQCVAELLLNVVEILKSFNSRTCQLILGAGALQLVGLKTISVKHLALASRSLQLVAKFIPVIRKEFENHLPVDRHNTLRHFDKALKDFQDHIDEISNKLLIVMDNHLISALNEWKVDEKGAEKAPTPAFQLIVKQIGKFYSGYSSVMPPKLSTEILHRIHANFRIYLKQHLQARGITPHNSLIYGMASQDFAYYVENMAAFPDCQFFPSDTLSEVQKA
ncbi:vps54-like protein domain-containing protein [Ditylenchus destructor]|uniref:Vacuolar protein sorting-associated protein 54 n=1 Tax=Ditylenchus destructor TaxID=166010 RepID=A0AAD4N8H2_9BILA|nr:vps54-like protein domain-containing protein [Ditylenchus destructor]